jgi:hypothetical protein
MQEGIFSLLRWRRSRRSRGCARGVPFVSVLTDPTTGGVAASLALGDVNVASRHGRVRGPRVSARRPPEAAAGFSAPSLSTASPSRDLIVRAPSSARRCALDLLAGPAVAERRPAPGWAPGPTRRLALSSRVRPDGTRLERMPAALALRGHPRARPALHVAGTNSKGSTAAMLDAVLGARVYRTGLYVPAPGRLHRAHPHRRPDDPRGAVVGASPAAPGSAATRIPLTHFEFACEWFAEVGIDVGCQVSSAAVDATNLIHRGHRDHLDRIDHVEFLGADLASIAGKAGIVSPACAFSGAYARGGSRRVHLARRGRAAPVLRPGRRAPARGEGLASGRRGVLGQAPARPAGVQARQRAVALSPWCCATASRARERSGRARGSAGRVVCGRRGTLVVLDGAHTPDRDGRGELPRSGIARSQTSSSRSWRTGPVAPDAAPPPPHRARRDQGRAAAKRRRPRRSPRSGVVPVGRSVRAPRCGAAWRAGAAVVRRLALPRGRAYAELGAGLSPLLALEVPGCGTEAGA